MFGMYSLGTNSAGLFVVCYYINTAATNGVLLRTRPAQEEVG